MPVRISYDPIQALWRSSRRLEIDEDADAAAIRVDLVTALAHRSGPGRRRSRLRITLRALPIRSARVWSRLLRIEWDSADTERGYA
jgi:hypothetical protein